MKRLLLSMASVCLCISSFAQLACPPNLDFELGNLSYWNFYIGSCCPINTPTLTTPISGRHTLQSSATTLDPYGNFPTVAPGGGNYSLKLGNSNVNYEAERARYYIHVPNNVNNYSLIYRYAVVFEDPGSSHTSMQKPRFEVKAFDSTTNMPISCAQYTYVAGSSLPGFLLSSSGSNVWYKDWTTASLNLSGMAGKTIAVDFASGDCALGGHFGYGYVDMGCGLFAIQNVNCNGAPNTTLNAPPGFMTYTWTDAGYNTIDTGQTITIPTPSTSTVYHVILTPYTGFGCPDTLHTTVSISNINLKAPNDTFVCPGGNLQLNPIVTSAATPVTYTWTPSTNLTCNSCAGPVASPAASTKYFITVTDPNGCSKTDSVTVAVGPIINFNKQNVPCKGDNNGSATALPSLGHKPYTYTWNTTPVQNTATATGLTAGTYTVTITDSLGCSKTNSVTITQPATLLQSSANVSAHVSCFNGQNGIAQATASGGIPPYTFSWNTTPIQNTATATSLKAGTYTVTIADSAGCVKTSQITINQPTQLTLNTQIVRNACTWEKDGVAYAIATNGTPPYQYSWNTIPVQNTDTAKGLGNGNYTITLTDAKNCSTAHQIFISNYPNNLVDAGPDRMLCNGQTLQLNATGGNNYHWTPATWLSCTQCASPRVSATDTIVYLVSGTDKNNCLDSAFVKINVIKHGLSKVGDEQKICLGDSTQLVASGGVQYMWSPTQSLNDPTIANPKAFPKTDTRYQVLVIQNQCFTDTLFQSVRVLEAPTVTLPPDFKAIPGSNVELIADAVRSHNITWTPTNGLSCSDCYKPTATIGQTITYTATVRNDAGCSASDDITITAMCDGSVFYMPNTFTPDADGENDFLFPQGKGINTISRFMIYNRWGEIVFQAANFPANDFHFGWNGTVNNVAVKPDVFIYVVEAVCATGERAVIKGDVALIR
ncbi:MAG: gliding motility-associated C-terminal domain-containing protein [Bacteroidetes bacterium]|nr:gliding motility-associated C-terminal domain-containing protein [Bacteroidota bacterium]